MRNNSQSITNGIREEAEQLSNKLMKWEVKICSFYFLLFPPLLSKRYFLNIPLSPFSLYIPLRRNFRRSDYTFENAVVLL